MPREVTYAIGGPGQTPFVTSVTLTGSMLPSLVSLAYTIEPKSGASAAPVHVTYAMAALNRKGYVTSPSRIVLPVFGLYAGYSNIVDLTLRFSDNSVQNITATIATADYRDTKGIYDSPVVLVRRPEGRQLGFDFMALKSMVGSPVIIDTDGEVRWIASGILNSGVSAFQDNGFYVGSNYPTTLNRIELDGSVTRSFPNAPGYLNFHHNFDPGPHGLLAEVATTQGLGSTIAEVDPAAGFVREWRLDNIIAVAMAATGDDPALFVRNGADWFHPNSVTYRASDNTLIVSSRENFLIAIDYDTSAIKWILGDPNKYWHSFASLQDKALTLQGTGNFPIGQHSVSVTRDGLVLVFNNGEPSINQPSTASVGASRTYSTVSAYRVDAEARTATEVWNFDYGQSIYSSFCSSAYEASDGSVLIDYAMADAGTSTRVVGLDNQHQVVFDFQYPNDGCGTSWNAVPVPLGDLRFD